MYLSLIRVSKRTKGITGQRFFMVNAEVVCNKLYSFCLLTEVHNHYQMHTTEMSQKIMIVLIFIVVTVVSCIVQRSMQLIFMNNP